MLEHPFGCNKWLESLGRMRILPITPWQAAIEAMASMPFTCMAPADEEIQCTIEKINAKMRKMMNNYIGCNDTVLSAVGHTCKSCKEYYPDAIANQEDGSLICYSCRNGW